MGTKMVEFKSKREYDEWLQEMGDAIRVLNVSTTKRWSFMTGFLGDTKTYTVTYEQEPTTAPTTAWLSSSPRTYCTKCGAGIQAGSNFCAGCGAPAKMGQPPAPQSGAEAVAVRREVAAEARVTDPRVVEAKVGSLGVGTAIVVGATILVFVVAMLNEPSSTPAPSTNVAPVASQKPPAPRPDSNGIRPASEVAPRLPKIPEYKAGTVIQHGPDRTMTIVSLDCGKPARVRREGTMMIWEYPTKGYNLNWLLPVTQANESGPLLVNVENRNDGTLTLVDDPEAYEQQMPCIRTAVFSAGR